MSKFNKMLTTTGSDLIEKRAQNRTKDAQEAFNGEKLDVEKQIRELETKVSEMEDMAIRSTDALVVGENINMTEWVKKRINYALELNDLKVERDIIDGLIKEYFDEEGENDCSKKQL
jgi:hypothetical protein